MKKKTYENKSMIYLPESEKIVFEKFRQICEREGTSVSSKLRDFIRDYVRVHEPGNPQLLLEKFTGAATEPLPRYLTCRHSRKALTRGEFYCDREDFWKISSACDKCHRYLPEPVPPS